MHLSDTASAAISIGFHGLAFAMVLCLISVGLSVTMGLMGFVNLAHGVFAMAGGYVLTSLMSRAGVAFLPALLAAAVFTALASLPIERLLYRRLYGGEELDQVLMTMGIVFIERCYKLLDKKGRLAIILPEGYLSTPMYGYVRQWLARQECRRADSGVDPTAAADRHGDQELHSSNAHVAQKQE